VLVAMTGYGQATDKLRSQDAGFNHHLVKPTDFGEVQQILATVSGECNLMPARAKHLRSQTVQDQQGNRELRAEMNLQLSLVIQQHYQLVNMRLNDEINSDIYVAKSTEHRDREAN
jgi:hypothetical protein